MNELTNGFVGFPRAVQRDEGVWIAPMVGVERFDVGKYLAKIEPKLVYQIVIKSHLGYLMPMRTAAEWKFVEGAHEPVHEQCYGYAVFAGKAEELASHMLAAYQTYGVPFQDDNDTLAKVLRHVESTATLTPEMMFVLPVILHLLGRTNEAVAKVETFLAPMSEESYPFAQQLRSLYSLLRSHPDLGKD